MISTALGSGWCILKYMKRKTEGWLEVLAAVIVLYMAATEPAVAASIAGVIFLVMGAWRLHKTT